MLAHSAPLALRSSLRSVRWSRLLPKTIDADRAGLKCQRQPHVLFGHHIVQFVFGRELARALRRELRELRQRTKPVAGPDCNASIGHSDRGILGALDEHVAGRGHSQARSVADGVDGIRQPSAVLGGRLRPGRNPSPIAAHANLEQRPVRKLHDHDVRPAHDREHGQRGRRRLRSTRRGGRPSANAQIAYTAARRSSIQNTRAGCS